MLTNEKKEYYSVMIERSTQFEEDERTADQIVEYQKEFRVRYLSHNLSLIYVGLPEYYNTTKDLYDALQEDEIVFDANDYSVSEVLHFINNPDSDPIRDGSLSVGYLKNKTLYERAYKEFEAAKKMVDKDGKSILFDLRNQTFELYREYLELTVPQQAIV